MNTKPCLLLDVDGPLNAYRASTTPENYTTHYFSLQGLNALKVILNPSHGESLLSLGYDIIWATMWEEDANKFISPNIGLPELPVIKFPKYYPSDYTGRYSLYPNLYFKTTTILKYMNELDRPYVWVDDECTVSDREFLALYSTAPCDTLRIDPAVGLVDADFARLAEIYGELSSRIPLEGHRSQSQSLTASLGT